MKITGSPEICSWMELNKREAIFIECSREGVNLIDNNIFWNVRDGSVPKRYQWSRAVKDGTRWRNTVW